MALFRDEAPVLSSSATVDDQVSLTGTSAVSSPNNLSPVGGAWIENFSPIAAANTSFAAYIAPYKVRVLAVTARFGTASSSGTLKIEDTPSGTAVGSGTALMSSTISLAGTANTNVSASGKLIANPVVPAGDAISIILGGTLTSLANCVVSITLQKA